MIENELLNSQIGNIDKVTIQIELSNFLFKKYLIKLLTEFKKSKIELNRAAIIWSTIPALPGSKYA